MKTDLWFGGWRGVAYGPRLRDTWNTRAFTDLIIIPEPIYMYVFSSFLNHHQCVCSRSRFAVLLLFPNSSSSSYAIYGVSPSHPLWLRFREALWKLCTGFPLSTYVFWPAIGTRCRHCAILYYFKPHSIPTKQKQIMNMLTKTHTLVRFPSMANFCACNVSTAQCEVHLYVGL